MSLLQRFRYKVEDDTVISGTNEKKFLSHIETKADLTEYLSLAAIKYFEKRSIGYVVVFDTKSISNLEGYSTTLATHDHEEADTLILLHALDVSSRDPFSKIDVFSPDTDVFLLLINKHDSLCADTNFVTGYGEDQESTSIGKCCEVLGPDLCAALIGFHFSPDVIRSEDLMENPKDPGGRPFLTQTQTLSRHCRNLEVMDRDYHL